MTNENDPHTIRKFALFGAHLLAATKKDGEYFAKYIAGKNAEIALQSGLAVQEREPFIVLPDAVSLAVSAVAAIDACNIEEQLAKMAALILQFTYRNDQYFYNWVGPERAALLCGLAVEKKRKLLLIDGAAQTVENLTNKPEGK